MKIRIGYIIKKYREAHNYDQASLARLARLTRGVNDNAKVYQIII